MKEKGILLAAYFLLLALIILGAASCSVASKNRKAVKRVKADVELLNEVGKEWSKLNPCSNDTVIQSKTDTVITSDTSTVYEIIHSSDTVVQQKVITKTIKIRDTVKTVVKDNREINRLLSELSAAITAKDIAQNQTIRAQENEKKAESKARTYLWILIAIGVVLGVFTYLKLQPSLPKINLN